MASAGFSSSAYAPPPENHDSDDAPTWSLRASLVIDTSDVGAAGPIIHRRIAERGDVVLRSAEIMPSLAAEDPIILITVHELTGDDPGFTVSIDHEGTREDVDCTLCTETELVSRVEARLITLAEQIRAGAAPGSESETPGPPAASTEPAPSEPQEPTDRDRLLGPMGKAGIGVLAAGVASLGVGIGLAVSPPRPKRRMPLEAIDTRRPGYAVLASGGALVIVGAVLLGIDLKHERKTTAAPLWGPHQAGIVVRGTF
jgi:hypothetical protein